MMKKKYYKMPLSVVDDLHVVLWLSLFLLPFLCLLMLLLIRITMLSHESKLTAIFFKRCADSETNTTEE